MTRVEARVPIFMVVALSVCVAVGACSTSEPDPETEGPTPGFISVTWVEREVMLHTFDRMLSEGDPEEILENSTGSRDDLFDANVLHEGDDGYFIEFDKNAWRTDEVSGLNWVDVALINATDYNYVTWCGETVAGDVFVEDYMEEFWDTLDSHGEYTASIADYVDCGDGHP